MNRRIYTLLLLISICFFIIGACSSATNTTTENAQDSAKREIASHLESLGEGEVVTKIFEERKNGLYIITVQIIRNGKLQETVHSFDSNNFTISIPVSANIIVQQAANISGSPDVNITLFSQRLSAANDAMLKADYIQALESINSALQIDNFNPQAHMMKGSIFYAMGKRGLARKEFDYVLKVDPTNSEVTRFKEQNISLWENTPDNNIQVQ